MIGTPWKRHLARLITISVMVVIAGWITGQLAATLILALGAYTAWLVGNMFRLYDWLHNDRIDPPESLGVWSEIFERIHELQKGNRDQHAQNQRIIGEFRSMTNAFPDATLVLDENDAIIWFNEAARQLLGLRSSDDVGQPVTNLLRDPEFADWIAVQERVESAFEMANPLDANIRLSVSAIRYRQDQRLLIIRDITNFHNLEQVRRDFVANVSHELRTPLTVLFGYLESLRDHADPDTAPAITRMHEQAVQMQALLNDLLELSRLQSEANHEREETVNVCAMLMQLREQAEEISQGQHEIEVRCDSDLAITGNEKDLESAFRNLINNAIHYTPEGGSLAIRWKESRDGLIFRVSDTGIGIPARHIPRLTERFYRVGSDRSRHTGGTGLGLSIVKHVLNAHGARLQIESELGEGSTFTCVFPHNRRAVIERTQEVGKTPSPGDENAADDARSTA